MHTSYDDNVFLNCPFDKNYWPILESITFAIHDCGFFARSALESDDGSEVRIRKIQDLVRICRYGIHDISRIELSQNSGLPRFNMPLELGIFLGAKSFGSGPQPPLPGNEPDQLCTPSRPKHTAKLRFH